MVIFIIVVLLIIIAYANIKDKQSSTKTDSITPFKRTIGTYKREKLEISLTGVKYRQETWDTIRSKSELFIRFDGNNSHDKNAIGAYTNDGKLVGYLPRNQWKLIKTLKENSNCFAFLKDKKGYYRGGSSHGNLRGTLDLYLGFSNEELQEIRKNQLDVIKIKNKKN